MSGLKKMHPYSVAIFGEALVDQFESGPVVGGAPFNVVTAIGQDAHGALVRDEFFKFGISEHGTQIKATLPTGKVSVVSRSMGTHEFIIEKNCAYDHIDASAVETITGQLEKEGWLYFGTLAMRSETSYATWKSLMHTHSGPRYVDLNWRNNHVEITTALAIISEATVLKLNEDELSLVLTWCRLDSITHGQPWRVGQQDLQIQALARIFSFNFLIVTLGNKGYVCFDVSAQCICASTQTRPIELVDTVGAGDSFSAVVLHGLLNDWPIKKALNHAHEFAAHMCEQQGAVPTDLSLYKKWTQSWT
jgi:fructokinase